jgi:hypothetical protein
MAFDLEGCHIIWFPCSFVFPSFFTIRHSRILLTFYDKNADSITIVIERQDFYAVLFLFHPKPHLIYPRPRQNARRAGERPPAICRAGIHPGGRQVVWRVYPTRQNGDAGQAIFLAGLPDDQFGGPSISL